MHEEASFSIIICPKKEPYFLCVPLRECERSGADVFTHLPRCK